MAGNRSWLWGVLLFFGAFFLLLAAQEGCYRNAIRVQGIVTDKAYSPGTSSVGRVGTGSSSDHKIRYRFTTPDGKMKEHWSKVLPGTWRKLNKGDPVDIEYLPAIADSRIPGQTASGPAFFAISLAFFTGGVYFRRRKQRSGDAH